MTSHGDDNQYDGEMSYTGRASVPAPRPMVPEPVPVPVGAAAPPMAAHPRPVGVASIPLGAVPPTVPKDKDAQRKKEKRRRILIAGLALVIMFSGVGVIAGTYFYDQIITPDELTLENSTEVFGSDGTTQIAKLGSKNRTEVAVDKLPEAVRNALIAGEDKNFYTHNGIDLWGIG